MARLRSHGWWWLPACLVLAGCAGSPPPAAPVARSDTQARPATIDPALRAAFDAANAGRLDDARLQALRDQPLHGWLEFLQLRHDMHALPTQRAEAFLQAHAGQPVAALFRQEWLQALATRGEAQAFLQAWDGGIESTTLRCHWLRARRQTGDARWQDDAVALWRQAAQSLPAACDDLWTQLQDAGALTPAVRWARIDAAAARAQTGVMRAAAAGLPADERRQAIAYADYLDAPTAAAARWPANARGRRIATEGMLRKVRNDVAATEGLLATIAPALGLEPSQRDRVRAQVALWSAVNHDPATPQRMRAVPAAVFDLPLREWQARAALARGDWQTVRTAITAMPQAGRDDARWQYFAARAAEALGDQAGADALYQAAARRPEYHGFLAADRLQLPYPLCPLEPAATPADHAALDASAALTRALQLQALDRPGWARREWDHAIAGMPAVQRQLAVERAQAQGWFDRAVFGLVNVGGVRHHEETRLYRLRFPLHHAASIEREAARQRIDPAWVAAEIRAESIFDPQARSPADARGLMQILPATGEETARRIGLAWSGPQSLYDADTSIALGSAYLRHLVDLHGEPYRVIAGYNAGPTALRRWIAQRGQLDPDVWVETIPYKETRDYVGRVLSFSAIYDWRMHGQALRVSERMLGRSGERTRFACPAAD